MKISVKKLITFLWICGLLLAIAGCNSGPGDYPGDGDNDDDYEKIQEIKNAINERVHSFKEAVERYDVDGMLAFLDENSFELTIAENNNEAKKSYTTLKKELEEDEGKQLHWRDPVPEGHGYTLTMTLEDIMYSSLTPTGAYLSVGFTILEKAEDPKLEERVTDRGHMVYEMVHLLGEWRCRHMIINFWSMDGRQLISSMAAQKGKTYRRNRLGFSFGVFAFED